MTENLSVCPGCGARLPDDGYPTEERSNASSPCWRAFGELSAYTLAHGDPAFIHQHAVDAYGVQHASGPKSNLRVAFGLIGMYLSIERNQSGRMVQQAHMKLGRLKRKWPDFDRPPKDAALTVVDVLNAEPGSTRDEMLRNWMVAIWESWSHYHAWTRQTCAELLGVPE